jgi:glc operon protein GlcG
VVNFEVIHITVKGAFLLFLAYSAGATLAPAIGAVSEEESRHSSEFWPPPPTARPPDRRLEGGIPLLVGGQVAGAVGVTGVTPAQDGQIAQAAVSAFPASP